MQLFQAFLNFMLRFGQQLCRGGGGRRTQVGDKLMPYFYARQLPLGFGGLILANFLCDAMQTLVSGVNSVTAVASQDLLEHSRTVRSHVHNRLTTARFISQLKGPAVRLPTLPTISVAMSQRSRHRTPPSAASRCFLRIIR